MRYRISLLCNVLLQLSVTIRRHNAVLWPRLNQSYESRRLLLGFLVIARDTFVMNDVLISMTIIFDSVVHISSDNYIIDKYYRRYENKQAKSYIIEN